MRTRTPWLAFVASTAVSLSTSGLFAQRDPEKSLADLVVAEGLEVSLFAAEPLFVNPTCFDVDPQGRLWICEGVNYRGRARPPFRKTGDRIVVVEDKDGDGRADTSRVFYEGLDLESPLGICYLGDRILVSQSPEIFSIAIRPDGTAGEKTLFLGGFGGKNHDHGVHSMLLGPDGLLYCAFGNEGARVTDPSGRRIYTDGKPYFGGCVFRCNLDGSQSEVLAHNFRNNYECAIDSFGDIWQSDNDDDGNQWVRFTYVLHGGNYGYLGPTGRHWGQEKKSHFHMEDPGVVPTLLRTGAGSPTGLCVYEGALLPEKYRGLTIHTDAGPRFVQCFRVKPHAAGWHVEGAPLDKNGHQTVETLSTIVRPEVILTSKEDSFFRPSDVAVAPDGSLLVSDWYDPGVGGHGMGDTTRGRIYRLTPKGHKGYKSPAFDLGTDAGLTAAFLSPALSVRSLATLKLIEKKDDALPLLSGLAGGKDPLARARALWLLGRLEQGRSHVLALLRDPEPRFRILGIRSLKQNAGADFLRLIKPLASDADAQVRREVLVQLRDVAGPEALETIIALAGKYDGHDRWYLESIAIASRGREGAVFQGLAATWKGALSPAASGLIWVLHPPEAADHLLARLADASTSDDERLSLVQALSELEGDVGMNALSRTLAGDAPAALKRDVARLIEGNLAGKWQRLRKDDSLRAGAETLLKTPGLEESGAKLVAAARLGALRNELERVATSASVAPAGRVAAVQALGALNDKAATEALAGLAGSGTPLAFEAVQALGRLSGSEPQNKLRTMLTQTESAELRSAVVKALGSSKSGAVALLQMAREGELPDASKALATIVVHSSAFEDVRLMAEKMLPRPQTSAGKELPPVAELLRRQGDAGRGRKVFFEESKGNCARCHKVSGKGSDVGPDLTVIGTKFGREGMLEAILSPSAAISHEYKVWVLETTSVGFVNGYIADETPEKVTLRDANGQKLVLQKGDILSRTGSDVSLMPEGLVGTMTADDLVDLLEFVAALKPAQEPKKPAGG